jgi:WD40 repeat protein
MHMLWWLGLTRVCHDHDYCVASKPIGHVYILKRNTAGDYELIHTIQAHSTQIYSVALNKEASMLATACPNQGTVKLWDVTKGVYGLD